MYRENETQYSSPDHFTSVYDWLQKHHPICWQPAHAPLQLLAAEGAKNSYASTSERLADWPVADIMQFYDTGKETEILFKEAYLQKWWNTIDALRTPIENRSVEDKLQVLTKAYWELNAIEIVVAVETIDQFLAYRAIAHRMDTAEGRPEVERWKREMHRMLDTLDIPIGYNIVSDKSDQANGVTHRCWPTWMLRFAFKLLDPVTNEPEMRGFRPTW